MFERIIIRRHDTESAAIDAGQLAESLLFYDSIHLVLDGSGLRSLLKQIGADTLIGLLRDKRATVSFVRDILATHSQSLQFGLPQHRFWAFRISAHPDGRPYKNKHMVESAFDDVLGKGKLARAKAQRFLRYIEFTEYVSTAEAKNPDAVTTDATKDLNDADYVRHVVEKTLLDAIPGYHLQDRWFFNIQNNTDYFTVSSNLDFAKLNEEYAKAHSIPDRISIAWLAGQILEVRGDLHFASKYMAELATDPLRSQLIQIKLESFIRRRVASAGDIKMFQDIHLRNGFAIREAINSGQHSFDDFLKLLDRANKFKTWLSAVNPDAKLLDEYFKAATQDTWAERLPTKGTRFAIFTGLGAALDTLLPTHGIGTALGVGTSAVDSFWVDRLLKGWRPNQFVDGPLKKFIDDE